MSRAYRHSDYINTHIRIDSVVLHITWENFYPRTLPMTCGSLISGQIKNVTVTIKGKSQTELEYCDFRGIEEVEKKYPGHSNHRPTSIKS